jgi:hypothetical protein
VVTATTAWLASRPVAKALGEKLSMMATRGFGTRAYVASSSTRRWSPGASAGLTSRAPAMRRARSPENQYAPRFITSATTNANAMPLWPPIAPPITMNSAVGVKIGA